MKYFLKCLFSFSLMTMLCVSCSTTSRTEKRISKNQEKFASQSSEHQQLIRERRIIEGMNRDAVFLAWGKADSITSGSKEGQATETWLYGDYESQFVPNVRFGYGSGYGGSAQIGAVNTYSRNRLVPDAKVVFTNGVVTEWQAAQ